MNTLNIDNIVKKELVGKTLVKLEFSEGDDWDTRSRFYGCIIEDAGIALNENGEDSVIWLYFEDGPITAYCNEDITVK